MNFSSFELSMILIMVTEKVLRLKMDLLSLEHDKKYIIVDEFNKKKREYTITLEYTENLKNKIEKMLEE